MGEQIQWPRNEEVYERLQEVASLLGWPQAFTTDLTHHDRKFVEAMEPGTSFGWIVYPCGTHLITLGMSREDMATVAGHEKRAEYFVWNGHKLVQCTSWRVMIDYLCTRPV